MTTLERQVDPDTGEVAVDLLDFDEAQALTSRIKGHVAKAWMLLSEAHERKAWIALKYATWAEYVETEFEMSRSNAYRLLDLAKVVKELEAGLIAVSWSIPDDPLSRARDISQRDAEALAPLLDQPSALVDAFVAAEETAEAEGRTRTSADLKDAVADLKDEEPPAPRTKPAPRELSLHDRFDRTVVDAFYTRTLKFDAAQVADEYAADRDERKRLAGFIADARKMLNALEAGLARNQRERSS